MNGLFACLGMHKSVSLIVQKCVLGVAILLGGMTFSGPFSAIYDVNEAYASFLEYEKAHT